MKKGEGKGEEEIARRHETRLSCPRDVPGNRAEARYVDHNMAVWRGRARDKMATSEKLAEENHGRSISTTRARARARSRPLGPTEFPAIRSVTPGQRTLKSQTVADSRGKFAYRFGYPDDGDEDESPYLSKTFAIS